jgi:nicotinate-nucleotide--dimethylbenzimidazole phosphoribosyltransferase
MDAARAAGRAEPAVWLAGCAGAAAPAVRSRVVVLEGAAVPRVLSVREVAAAVDAGRALAARSATGGVTVLASQVVGARATVSACALTVLLTNRPASAVSRGGQVSAVEATLERHAGALTGPLSALRRLGGGALARTCGVALGAGEHGLAFVADGLGATVAAALALRIQPSLAPRVRLAGHGSTPAEGALRDVLGLAALVDGPADATSALALLRRACAG